MYSALFSHIIANYPSIYSPEYVIDVSVKEKCDNIQLPLDYRTIYSLKTSMHIPMNNRDGSIIYFYTGRKKLKKSQLL